MIRKFDDYIFDRIFQPIADWLSDIGTSCYKVAQQTIMGAAIFFIINTVVRTNDGQGGVLLSVSTILLLFACAVLYMRIGGYENKPEGTVPIERLEWLPHRIFVICMVLYIIFGTSLTERSSLAIMASATADILLLISMYLMACVKNPPRKTFNRMVYNT